MVVLAGADITLPHGCWQLHANKTNVLCMTHELAEWNGHLNHAAQECAMLASQVLFSLQEAVEQRQSDLLRVLDSVRESPTVFYKTAGIVLSVVKKSLPKNLEYLYLRVPSCRSLVATAIYCRSWTRYDGLLLVESPPVFYKAA